jgi:hypothetical protein
MCLNLLIYVILANHLDGLGNAASDLVEKRHFRAETLAKFALTSSIVSNGQATC